MGGVGAAITTKDVKECQGQGMIMRLQAPVLLGPLGLALQ